MKKLFFATILMIVAYIGASAQPARSILKFKFSDNSRLAVSIDDRYYDKQGRSITVGDLPAGRHFIKIYKYIPYSNGKGGKAKEVYRGGIRISAGTISSFTYDLHDEKLYTNTEMIDGSYTDRDNSDDDRYNNDRRDDMRDDYRDDRNNRRDRDDVYYSRQWSQQDMSDLKARVDDRITDGEKLKLMQSVLKDRRYTTEQMRSMIKWLSFDDTKLSFAKWGYDNASDKQNYWKLESELTFSSSKDDFNNYINGRK